MKIFLAFILCAGCYTKESLRDADAKMLSESLTYFVDDRTGVCYSGAYLQVDGAIWSGVTCTAEIEKTAVHFRSEP